MLPQQKSSDCKEIRHFRLIGACLIQRPNSTIIEYSLALELDCKTKFTWGWCSLCQVAYVRCPKCGNNCCNGVYGQVDGQECDVCELAYQYQELADEAGRTPTREEVEAMKAGEAIGLYLKKTTE